MKEMTDNVVTATGAVNTAVTATLPAPGPGLFHYITAIEIVKFYSVVGVAAAAPIDVTTTNLPGSLAISFEQAASAAGSAVVRQHSFDKKPLKSSVENVATTIVCPAQLQSIWRVTVYYTTAAIEK